MEMFTWEYLSTSGGAAMAVTVITQFVKNFPFVNKINSQLVSYIVSLFVMVSAAFFTGTLTSPNAALMPLNAIVIMLAANGTYNTINKTKTGK